MAKRSVFNREVNGITIHQRKSDGYINATAMSKAHLEATEQRRDVNHWLDTEAASRAIEHLSLKTGIPVFKLVESRKGRYGATFIHPKLAVRFAMWLSDDFGYLVEEWVEEWMTAGRNPLTQAETERMEYRDNLKDGSRPRLVGQVTIHLRRMRKYKPQEEETKRFFASVHDEINIALTGERSRDMRARLSKIIGREVKGYELIRDYFPALELQRYIAICEVAANLMRERMEPLEAVRRAAELVLPDDYQPAPIDFTSHIKLIRRKAS